MSRQHHRTRCSTPAGELPFVPRSSLLAPRLGFTLFELILAIALSAMLLALIGAAINLYLVRVDASRTRIEEAQLARSVLAMIADDLRAAFLYEPQDTSQVAELASSAASYDVDAIDQPNQSGSSSSSTSSSSSSSSSSSGTTDGSSSSGSSHGSASLGSGSEPEGVLPLGVNGTLGELIVDVCRLPRLDEPLAIALQVGSPAAGSATDTSQQPRISDVKTIRYFVRQGAEVAPGSPAATSLSPDAQTSAGGLVRQEIDRAERTWAEQAGNQSLLQTAGVALVAPEVDRVEFRYFDGSQVVDRWDMKQSRRLPGAIEVRIWVASAETAAAQSAARYGLTNLAGSNQYWQTVRLPLSGLSPPEAAGQSASISSSSSTSDSSASSGTSSGTGTTSGGSSTTGGSGR
jgi:uncharacterized membrane protein YgcG